MEAYGWAVIISACGIIITQVVSMVLAYKREQAKIAREDRIADKVTEVARKQEQAVAKLDENTELTRTGTEAITKQLNGALDEKLAAIFDARVITIEEDNKDLRASVTAMIASYTELQKYSHEWKHKFANEFLALGLKLDKLLDA